MRITVADVLGWLAGGMSHQEIIEDFPELTEEDIRACLVYAGSFVCSNSSAIPNTRPAALGKRIGADELTNASAEKISASILELNRSQQRNRE